MEYIENALGQLVSLAHFMITLCRCQWIWYFIEMGKKSLLLLQIFHLSEWNVSFKWNESRVLEQMKWQDFQIIPF